MSEGKALGTLVIVAIEAKNLSTRDVVGKGDPFVAFHLDGVSRRIKADKQGGQHPNWDEEVRFEVMKNTSKRLKIQVFNDDKREPILIGDAAIELNEVLDKTEWDSWHHINFRNKYAGEVSLEMTFYYNEPPLHLSKKIAQNPPIHNNSLPPNSYPNATTHVAPPVTNNAPTSAPTGYPPSNIYPLSNSASPNVYPPLTSSPPPQSYPPLTSSPSPQSKPQSIGSHSQSPPVSYSGYPPAYPPISTVSPPQYGSSQGPSLAFPVPVPTPGPTPFGGYPPPTSTPGFQPPYPPNNPYPPNYPPANVYPPPPQNQGYPPNRYPPNGGSRY